MKPDKIILRSQDGEISDRTQQEISSAVNTIMASVGIQTEGFYYQGTTAKLNHNLIRVLESPTKICLRKVILPGQLPTFNTTNNKLKCVLYNINDNTLNQAFNIEFDVSAYTGGNVFTTYQELATEMTSKLQTATSKTTLSVTINNETGILTFVSTDQVWRVVVAERNLKFGFLFPWMPFFSGGNTLGHTPVQLSQTKYIYVRTNIETNCYSSDGDTKIIGVIPYSHDVKDFYGAFSYINNSDQYIDVQKSDYSKLVVELLDDEKNIIYLNRQPCLIELDLKYED